MATQAQIDANKRNAMLSTGPIGEEGKKRSRTNACKHGMSNSGPVSQATRADAKEELKQSLQNELQPTTF